MEGINLNINVILPGFESTLVTTDYAREGHTMDKVIVDLNYYPNRPTRLENVTVSLTRVTESRNCRLLPFNYNNSRGGIEHLLDLKHSTLYKFWTNSYNEFGIF